MSKGQKTDGCADISDSVAEPDQILSLFLVSANNDSDKIIKVIFQVEEKFDVPLWIERECRVGTTLQISCQEKL